MMNRLQTAIKNRHGTVAFATVVAGGIGYRKYKAEERLIEDSKKKKVLVLPFYKMKIVEEKKSSPSALLENLAVRFGGTNGASNKVIEMQADELVKLIHEAADDPTIESVYGIFGNGGTISTGGWAHLEEIRNALEVFSIKSKSQQQEDGGDGKKAMYAYSNTFGGPQSMKEYYLASVFQQIHLQSQGDLNLYGLHATNAFFRDFLKKYGITVDVWKHGVYKNMANVFTHSSYSKEHYENTAGILLPIHQHVCKAIYASRHEQLGKYDYNFTKFWTMIENAGSLPALVAHQIGFIDYLPKKNPLDKLIKNNKQRAKEEKMTSIVADADSDADTVSTTDDDGDDDINVNNTHQKSVTTKEDVIAEKWKLDTDPDNFKADSKISIDDYARQRAKCAIESNVVTKQLLSLVGYGSPEEVNSEDKAWGLKEKIVIIKINGTIGEATARKAEKALQQVKDQKDIKCVVLRVDSPGGSINACESIYQEIQDLPQKVVVSFGNVSASGGYYISSNAERIFASSTTVTGSIGVVMMRMDFRELAKRYGVTFDSIPTSALSGSNDPFYPINRKMNENFVNAADRSYHRFKSLVSEGRNIDMKTVEKIARGRVYTGDQALQIGLVDELGGLDSAIDFAQRNYTSSGDAQVVNWPPKKSLWEFIFTNRGDKEDDTNDYDDLDLPDVLHVAFGSLLEGINWTSSWKATASDQINSNFLLGNGDFTPSSLPVTSGVMLTVDENSAIQCILEDRNITQVKLVDNSTSL